MLMFLLGCFVGTFFGVMIMCLLQCNRLKDPCELQDDELNMIECDEHLQNPPAPHDSATGQPWERLF
ncbi:MAG: DUF3789 domain-containing protein [Gammaproteobacteria bacterium]